MNTRRRARRRRRHRKAREKVKEHRFLQRVEEKLLRHSGRMVVPGVRIETITSWESF